MEEERRKRIGDRPAGRTIRPRQEVERFNPLVEANGRGECKDEKRISSSRGQGSNNASSPLLPLRFIVGEGKWLGKGGPRVLERFFPFFFFSLRLPTISIPPIFDSLRPSFGIFDRQSTRSTTSIFKVFEIFEQLLFNSPLPNFYRLNFRNIQFFDSISKIQIFEQIPLRINLSPHYRIFYFYRTRRVDKNTRQINRIVEEDYDPLRNLQQISISKKKKERKISQFIEKRHIFYTTHETGSNYGYVSESLHGEMIGQNRADISKRTPVEGNGTPPERE